MGIEGASSKAGPVAGAASEETFFRRVGAALVVALAAAVSEYAGEVSSALSLLARFAGLSSATATAGASSIDAGIPVSGGWVSDRDRLAST